MEPNNDPCAYSIDNYATETKTCAPSETELDCVTVDGDDKVYCVTDDSCIDYLIDQAQATHRFTCSRGETVDENVTKLPNAIGNSNALV